MPRYFLPPLPTLGVTLLTAVSQCRRRQTRSCEATWMRRATCPWHSSATTTRPSRGKCCPGTATHIVPARLLTPACSALAPGSAPPTQRFSSASRRVRWWSSTRRTRPFDAGTSPSRYSSCGPLLDASNPNPQTLICTPKTLISPPLTRASAGVTVPALSWSSGSSLLPLLVGSSRNPCVSPEALAPVCIHYLRLLLFLFTSLGSPFILSLPPHAGPCPVLPSYASPPARGSADAEGGEAVAGAKSPTNRQMGADGASPNRGNRQARNGDNRSPRNGENSPRRPAPAPKPKVFAPPPSFGENDFPPLSATTVC